MLVRRRIALLGELFIEYGIEWRVDLVRSEKNHADPLTRVPKSWLLDNRTNENLIRKSHQMHHRGVEGTLHFAKKTGAEVPLSLVKDIVKSCSECSSIDPASKQCGVGSLSVDENWQRLAVDVTHVGNVKFLTIVDCGPSRFAVWRALNSESETEVCQKVGEVFSQMGPPGEVLCDNGRTFRSGKFSSTLSEWGVALNIRCAYWPSGNGIVERNHRTIKTSAARAQSSINRSVYWYNLTPRSDGGLIPAASIFKDEWRNPFLVPVQESEAASDNEEAEFCVGEEVWVKPPNARCTDQWKRGVVSEVNSPLNIEVNGVPRHPKDLRRRAEGLTEDRRALHLTAHHERPKRTKKRPRRLEDYVCDEDIIGECSDVS
eukprot:TRINITY_DN3890_c0_g1_i1.p1 TRINITY_DN3890_c0_g1~~TRINITY_DN3890_c0_g1_i1.p1  ORF type:complete len:374 (-),score=6.81 TRINITY_DN3890_c0_g1_i1:9-1130(-)